MTLTIRDLGYKQARAALQHYSISKKAAQK